MLARRVSRLFVEEPPSMRGAVSNGGQEGDKQRRAEQGAARGRKARAAVAVKESRKSTGCAGRYHASEGGKKMGAVAATRVSRPGGRVRSEEKTRRTGHSRPHAASRACSARQLRRVAAVDGHGGSSACLASCCAASGSATAGSAGSAAYRRARQQP